MQHKKVGVLMGGQSNERAISLVSGNAVLQALLASGINAVGIDLQQEWDQEIRAHAIDIAFVALHGPLGEDGCVQGMLESMGIPYTGSGVLASSINMNKRVCKQLLNAAGLKTPVDIPLGEQGPIRYPAIIKPSSEGSSIGLHRINTHDEWLQLNLDPAIDWMVEMPVHGVEVAVSVLDGQALPAVEIAPRSGVYDFESKYTQGATEYFCPARIPPETHRRCMEVAKQATAATFCAGAPRVDMILADGGEPVILEINTIPGMTPSSLLPKAAAAAGINFNDLCLTLLATAHRQTQVLLNG
ncbi:MAG: D-alanine--D-alanine ligase [Zetaproteobacteria bacterium]|nr:D-alanine--D-alanine ligase [Zetaproteobacteria bacterium]